MLTPWKYSGHPAEISKRPQRPFLRSKGWPRARRPLDSPILDKDTQGWSNMMLNPVKLERIGKFIGHSTDLS